MNDPRANSPTMEQPTPGVYLVKDGAVTLLLKDYNLPNGIAHCMSLLLVVVFVGYILYALFGHFVKHAPLVPGWTSLMCAITVFGTIQLLLFGVFGEYLGRVYEQVKNRPLYIIMDVKYFPTGEAVAAAQETLAACEVA